MAANDIEDFCNNRTDILTLIKSPNDKDKQFLKDVANLAVRNNLSTTIQGKQLATLVYRFLGDVPPATRSERHHHGRRLHSCKDLNPMYWTGNSCYIDSTLLALYGVENDFIDDATINAPLTIHKRETIHKKNDFSAGDNVRIVSHLPQINGKNGIIVSIDGPALLSEKKYNVSVDPTNDIFLLESKNLREIKRVYFPVCIPKKKNSYRNAGKYSF